METAGNIYALIAIESAGIDAGAILDRVRAMAFANVRMIETSNAAQVKAAFLNAGAIGCTHVIAIEPAADHSADALMSLMHSAGENPASLILGRPSSVRASGIFSRLSNLLLRLETGHRLHRDDGPRVYPVGLIDAIDPVGTRKSSELEILVRAVWAGCPIVIMDLPISPGQPLPSHSIPLPQKLRELGMHVRLLARVLSGFPNPRYGPAKIPAPRQSFWRMFWRWLNPFDAWRELRKGGASRNEMAVGLAVGAFIGNIPAWGLQTVISLYVARRLHLNPLAVMTGSHVSAPPMGALLIFSAMWTGHVILHGSPPQMKNITLLGGKFMTNGPSLLLDWTLGALLIGTALSIVVYLVANFLFRFIEKPS